MGALQTIEVIRLSDEAHIVINLSDFNTSDYRDVNDVVEPLDISQEELYSKILDAVTSLDTKDDSVWIQSGLPKIEVVERLVGVNVNREQVNIATGDAKRETLSQ